MKTLLTIFTLLFTVMIPSISFAGWTRVGEGSDGTNYYIDFDRIRKHDGYVYWWDMSDYLKPDKNGNLSVKIYQQGDCKLFRNKRLSYSYHKLPMGGGTGKVLEPTRENANWKYPSPDTANKFILKVVCSQ